MDQPDFNESQNSVYKFAPKLEENVSADKESDLSDSNVLGSKMDKPDFIVSQNSECKVTSEHENTNAIIETPQPNERYDPDEHIPEKENDSSGSVAQQTLRSVVQQTLGSVVQQTLRSVVQPTLRSVVQPTLPVKEYLGKKNERTFSFISLSMNKIDGECVRNESIFETDVIDENSADENIAGKEEIVEYPSPNIDNLISKPKISFVLSKEVVIFQMDKEPNTVPLDSNPEPGPAEPSDPNDLFFDDILEHVGEMGTYQWLLFLAMIPYTFSFAFVYFTEIFITIIPEKYWCQVPELSQFTPEKRQFLAIPKKDGKFETCKMYAVNFTEQINNGVDKPDPTWPTTTCQHGWEYDLSQVPYLSVATEYNWVCDHYAYPHYAIAIFFCGAILGGIIFGWVADHFGRKPALFGTNLTGFIASVATPLATTFWQYAVCRFFLGLAFDNCFTMMYILILEYVGPSWRTFVANMNIAIFFTLACVILPWIAYFIRDWRLLCIVTSLTLLLGVLLLYFVPESARWLVSQERVEEAIIIMKKFEKINRKNIDPLLYDRLRETAYKEALKHKEEEQEHTVLDLFKTPRLRKITILLCILWMTISLVFDGHIRQIMNLGTDPFITWSFASATEFPADTLLTFTLDVWGRRWYACGTLVFSGLFSMLTSFVESKTITAVYAVIGRFLVNISFNIGLQYSAEVLPTVVRAQGIAFIHIMGYVAALFSPGIIYLNVFDVNLPFFVLGIIGIVGGALSIFLPETLDEDLPDTLEEGEKFGRHQKLHHAPCCGKSGKTEKTEPS